MEHHGFCNSAAFCGDFGNFFNGIAVRLRLSESSP
jgi:hypothetical protein